MKCALPSRGDSTARRAPTGASSARPQSAVCASALSSVQNSSAGGGLAEAPAGAPGRVAITLDRPFDSDIRLSRQQVVETVIAAAYACRDGKGALELGVSLTVESTMERWRQDYESHWQSTCRSVYEMFGRVGKGLAAKGISRLFPLFQDEVRPEAHPRDTAKIKIPIHLGFRADTDKLIRKHMCSFLEALDAQRPSLLLGRSQSDPSFTDVLTHRILQCLEANPLDGINAGRLMEKFKTPFQRGSTYEDPSLLAADESGSKSQACRCVIL